MTNREVIEIPTQDIKAQTLERSVTDKGITELANSIKQLGILEPLLVLQTESGFNLLAGKRRLMAGKEAGLPTVPCIVLDKDQAGAFAVTLHENLYRENLNPVDEAGIYQQLRDRHRYSTREIAHMVGQSEGYVSQRLGIILWPDNLTKALFDQHINFSVARELSIITDLKHMSWLLQHCIGSGANYRLVRRWRIEWQAQVPPEGKEPDYSKPPEPESPLLPIERTCWWCGHLIMIDKIVPLEFCPDCFKGLESNKEQATK